jgi:hypothetical protein
VSNINLSSISTILWRDYCRTICKNVYLSLFTENMAMTGTNCLKLLIFQSVSMTMVYGFSGSDFETVSSGISQDILWNIVGMFILIPYND